jgi:hypothetical protein
VRQNLPNSSFRDSLQAVRRSHPFYRDHARLSKIALLRQEVTVKTILKRSFALFIMLLISGFATPTALAVPTGPSQGLAFDDTRNLVFYAAGGGAVTVLDVADPTIPVLVTDSIQTGGVVQDLYYDDSTQRLYIAADEGDFQIWDVQTPAAPQQISVTSLYYFGVEVPVVSVDVAGDYAFVSTSWGYLHWLDVSDPSNPADLGFNGQGGNPSREVFVADDGYVYLAGPQTVRYRINANGSLSLAGSNIYANSYEIFAIDGYAYITSGTGPVQILDAGQGSLPFVSTYDTNNVKDIFVAGDHAYLANGTTGLRILDVADKGNPHEVGFDDSAGATDVVVSGNYALVRSGATFRVVNVTDPANPIVIGAYDPVDGGDGNIAPVADAGPSQSVSPRARVTLDGSGSYDPDGSIEQYAWQQISGLAVMLRNANTVSPVFRAPRVKRNQIITLVFELTVTDDAGATGTSQVTVTVLR